jgi:hypothetical protein
MASVEPTRGTVLPDRATILAVRLDGSGLLPGVVEADVEIATNDPETPLAVLPVRIQVTPAAVLDVKPRSLALTVGGGVRASRRLAVCNRGALPLDFAAEARPGSPEGIRPPAWLSMVPATGSVSPGRCADVDVRVEASALSSGRHEGTIAVRDRAADGGLALVPVSVEVGLTTPRPSLTLGSPDQEDRR